MYENVDIYILKYYTLAENIKYTKNDWKVC